MGGASGTFLAQRRRCLLIKCKNRRFQLLYLLSMIIVEFVFVAISGCCLLHLRPNYIHSASNDIHTDGPRASARARARYSENLLIQHIS